MENLLQQLLREQKKINGKLDILQKKVNQLIDARQIDVRSSEFTTTTSLLPPSIPLSGSDNQAFHFDRFKLFKHLETLNDSLINNFSIFTISKYTLTFILPDDYSDFEEYTFYYPEDEVQYGVKYLLPYILIDNNKSNDSQKNIVIKVGNEAWTEGYCLYYITKDEVICKVNSICGIPVESLPRYDVQVLKEGLSIKLQNLVATYRIFDSPLICFMIDYAALNFDSRTLVLQNVILRTLIYFKIEDYIRRQEELVQHHTETLELEKRLSRFENSSILIGGLMLDMNDVYQMSGRMTLITEYDVGETYDKILTHGLFKSDYTKFTTDNAEIRYSLEALLTRKFDYEAKKIRVKTVMNYIKEECLIKVIDLLVLNVDLSQAALVHEPKLTYDSQKGDLFDSTITAKSSYDGRIPIYTFFHEGSSNEVYADELMYNGNLWVYSFKDESEKSNTIGITAGSYLFPPNAVSTFFDVLFFHPRMLPYDTEITISHDIRLKITKFLDSNGLSNTSFENKIDVKKAVFTNVIVHFLKGIKRPCIRMRIPLITNQTPVIGFRKQIYVSESKFRTKSIRSDGIMKLINSSPMASQDWSFYTQKGERFSTYSYLQGEMVFVELIKIPLLLVPVGFRGWVREYDLEESEFHRVLHAIIYRVSEHQFEIIHIKKELTHVNLLITQLTKALNSMEIAFNDLVHNLKESSHVPWWKKVLSGVVSITGTIGMLLFPFCAPLAIGLIAGSTIGQLGLLFSEGDYVTGAVQLAGTVIGVGIGFYSFRKAQSHTFKVTDLSKIGFIEPKYPSTFKTPELEKNGLWVEVRPLKMGGKAIENIGSKLITKHTRVLKTLYALENAPVHARVKSQSTSVIDNKVYRTTIVTGVDDGIAYLSRINPRPGLYEMKEVYHPDTGFINGWDKHNVPTTNDFSKIGRNIQGLLLEGAGTDRNFHTLMRSWEHFTLERRARILNESQDYIRRTQSDYHELPQTRIPLNFDPTLVKNVSEVFAKHTGIYEITGFVNSSGPNNCQTYTRELRDFFAKGALRKSKLNNTSFLNDLMESFDQSMQFSHSYGKVLTRTDRSNARAVTRSIL
uniref:Uncharacterized protein n=1 Tax=Reoviridae sp. BF02/7/10 TaxID=2511768 RepID=A0A411DBE5_9REOV|nr:hypothetical protein [Reoviridae sp. BF02/7/10]